MPAVRHVYFLVFFFRCGNLCEVFGNREGRCDWSRQRSHREPESKRRRRYKHGAYSSVGGGASETARAVFSVDCRNRSTLGVNALRGYVQVLGWGFKSTGRGLTCFGMESRRLLEKRHYQTGMPPQSPYGATVHQLILVLVLDLGFALGSGRQVLAPITPEAVRTRTVVSKQRGGGILLTSTDINVTK